MKLSLVLNKINKTRKVSISDIGSNPDIDWIVIINISILVAVFCVWYAYGLFSLVSEDRVTVDNVQVENVDLNRDGMRDVLLKYSVKTQNYRDVVSGNVPRISDPSF